MINYEEKMRLHAEADKAIREGRASSWAWMGGDGDISKLVKWGKKNGVVICGK